MRRPSLTILARTALLGTAVAAEHLDHNLKRAFHQAGLPTPAQTRGQMLATSLRNFAAKLKPSLPEGRGR
jgi:hypothetical protein